MGAADQIDVVLLVKLAHHLLAKCKGDAAIVVAVRLDASFRVGPQQIAQKARVGHVGRTHDVFDLVQIFQLGAQAAVHAENFLVDEGGDGEAIEDIAEDAPESDRVPAFAFVVETVDSIDLCTFVIAS